MPSSGGHPYPTSPGDLLTVFPIFNEAPSFLLLHAALRDVRAGLTHAG